MPPPDWIFTLMHLNPLICPLLKEWGLIDHFPLCVLSSTVQGEKSLASFYPTVSEIPLFCFIPAHQLAASLCLSSNNLPNTGNSKHRTVLFANPSTRAMTLLIMWFFPQVIKGIFSVEISPLRYTSHHLSPLEESFANSQIATKIIGFCHGIIPCLSINYCLSKDWKIRP